MTTETASQLLSMIPTFRVKDARAAEAYYREKLGFRTNWEHDPGDGYPVFLEMVRDKIALHLTEHEGDGPNGVSIYVNVTDARALFDEFRSADAEVTGPPQDAEWGEVVFSLSDLDGNTLRFGSPISPN